MVEGKHGLTAATPDNIAFGAGTIHKGLKYTEGTGWNFAESLVGATSGGSKLSIVPEIYRPAIDGVPGNVKGLAKKIDEKASMEVNFAELTPDMIKAAVYATVGTSADNTLDVYEPKADITDDDYWENIAFVGETLGGKKIIAILDNVLCTSGFDTEFKNRESMVGKYTFECHVDPSTDMATMPWHIYYPKAA